MLYDSNYNDILETSKQTADKAKLRDALRAQGERENGEMWSTEHFQGGITILYGSAIIHT